MDRIDSRGHATLFPPGTPLTHDESENVFEEANVRRGEDESGSAREEAVEGGGKAGRAFEPTLFDLAHSRHEDHHKTPSGRHVKAHHHPNSWKHLFKPPVVRQWLAGGILARESAERETARFELFFDLGFVGIIHQLAESAAEDESSWGIFKFIVSFWLAWSVWQDVRSFINTSGTDDIPQRIYVLAVMILLMGFSANASGLLIECLAEETPTAARLIRRAGVDPPKESASSESAAALAGGCALAGGWETNLHAAVAFFLIAKLLRIGMCLSYAYFLPKFRRAHLLRAGSIAAVCLLYVPLTFVSNPIYLVVLPVIGIALELVSAYSLSLLGKVLHSLHHRGWDIAPHDPRRGPSKSVEQAPGPHTHLSQPFTPALNLEHMIERTSLFVILVLGELILNITFRAYGREAGIHKEYLRCIFGLLIAYLLNWMYADSDGCRTFLHALRRHWFTSITWNHLHFPLTSSLVLVSAALAQFVQYDKPTQRMRWIFGGGLSVTMITLCAIGTLHKDLDASHSALLHRNWRLVGRLVAGIIFALLPLVDHLSATALLGIYASILLAFVATETIGKLGSVRSDEKILKALTSRKDGANGVHLALHSTIGKDVEIAEEHDHGLMANELGEDDAGVEGDLGELRVTRLGPQQRLAYTF